MKPLISISTILFLSTFNSQSADLHCDQQNIDFAQLKEQLSVIFINDTKVADNGKIKQQLFSTDTQQYLKLYNHCLKPVIKKHGINKYDKAQLHALYKALYAITLFSSDLSATTDFAKIIYRKVELKENPAVYIEKLYQAYIQTRQFTKAQELVNDYPQLNLSERVTVIDATGKGSKPYRTNQDGVRSLFTLNQQGNQITRHKFEFPQGVHIVVVSSSICNPCKRLFTWLKSEPQLMKVMEEHTTWLVPPEGRLFVNEMLETQKTFAPIKLFYAHKQQEWPEISYWATPTFYFYQNGELIGQLVGWPQEGQKEKLVAILKALSLV